MTLDVSIGKIVFERECITPRLSIKQCPNSKRNICDLEHTIFPKESYRSGSCSFWEFWAKPEIVGLYHKFRPNHPNSNDFEIAYLKQFLEEINKLPNKFPDAADTDRMKWFKYWSKKAVELYGDEAGISFS